MSLSPAPFVSLPPSGDAEGRLSRSLVESGVAPSAVVGWASRCPSGWAVGVGGATRAIFDLASLTKPMAALAVARSGLSRNANVADFVVEARGTPSAGATLELLLAHRAGLEAHLPLFAPLAEGRAFDRPAAVRAAANARRADASGAFPNDGFAPLYSDLGYVLAGEALAREERACDAGEAIEELVVAPLGLRDDLGTARALARRGIDFAARVEPTELAAWRGGEIRGEVHDENAWALTAVGGSGHAGIFGTVRGVLGFACAALDAIARGVGPLAAGDLAWLVRPRSGGSLRAGFDGKSETGSSAGDRASPTTFGHLGFTGTSFWIDPDAESVAVLLTNRVCPTRDNVAIRAARPAVHDALFTLAASARGG